MQRANWAKWCWDNRSTAQLSCWYYQLTIYPVSTSWEPRRQQYEDKCMQSPVQLTDSPASRWQSQSCFQYCTVMSAVEQFWQTMKLLSFHEVTSIHKLAGSVHVTWRPVVRSNRAQQTPDHLATASSCVSRQTAEARDMDVFRICLLIAHIAGQSNQRLLHLLSITAIFLSLLKPVINFFWKYHIIHWIICYHRNLFLLIYEHALVILSSYPSTLHCCIKSHLLWEHVLPFGHWLIGFCVWLWYF